MKLRVAQSGFSLFTIIFFVFLGWVAWVTLSPLVRQQDSAADEAQIADSVESESQSSNRQFQQMTLKLKNNFDGGGNATRSYEQKDGFELIITGALPALPDQVDYKAYYKGPAGTISVGTLRRESGAYRASYTSAINQFDRYDTVLIRVEGQKGTVEGNEVPFTVVEQSFPKF